MFVVFDYACCIVFFLCVLQSLRKEATLGYVKDYNSLRTSFGVDTMDELEAILVCSVTG